MKDNLAALLEHAADQYAVDAIPPPAPAPPRPAVAGSTGGPTSATWRRWAPLAAAAAVIAVAVSAVLLDGALDDGGGVTAIGSPVRLVPQPDMPLETTDAGLPNPGPGFLPNDLRPCAATDLLPALDLSSGLLKIDLRRGNTACTLSESISLTLSGAVRVRRAHQPRLPNPPVFDGRMLGAGTGVLLTATWEGQCLDFPPTAVVTGVGKEAVRASVAGTPLGCGGDGDPVLILGPPHRPGSPGAIVPADRGDLEISAGFRGTVSVGRPIKYTVRITNATEATVALRPCPTFKVDVRLADDSGGAALGRLPCDQLPAQLPARSSLEFLGDADVLPEPPAAVGQAKLKWEIAGPPPAIATAVVAANGD